VGATEWALLAAVILVPLVIAVAVTLWSLEQVRFRRKKVGPPPRRRPVASETPEE
jgi:hypothetical protein